LTYEGTETTTEMPVSFVRPGANTGGGGKAALPGPEGPGGAVQSDRGWDRTLSLTGEP
jgi:hypothetical protein